MLHTPIDLQTTYQTHTNQIRLSKDKEHGEKSEKILVLITSVLFFSHSIFKSLIYQGC